MTIRRFLILGLTLWMPAINGAAQSTGEDGYAPLLEALEHVLLAGEADAYLSLLSPAADRNAERAFAPLFFFSPARNHKRTAVAFLARFAYCRAF